LVEFRDHAFNVYTFGAGTVLVADRRIPEGELYCGNATINYQTSLVCLGFKPPSTVIVGLGAGFKQVERVLSPDDFEATKVKP
jgi:hypothetical protein